MPVSNTFVRSRLFELVLTIAVISVLFAIVPPFDRTVYPIARQLVFANSHPMFAAFGYCGNPCIVQKNYGGWIAAFKNAAKYARERNVRTIFDGDCLSGCAYFADIARSLSCVTKNARIGFHKWYELGGPFYSPPHAPDINRWVARNGGYNNFEPLIMKYPDTLQFWAECFRGNVIPKLRVSAAQQRGAAIFGIVTAT